jgi:hypothetical protein
VAYRHRLIPGEVARIGWRVYNLTKIKAAGGCVLILAADGPLSGIEVDVTGKKLTASQEVIATIFGALERMWSRALDWAERSPIEFALVIVLLMVIVVQRRRGKTTLTAMTLEYDLERERIRSQQPPLPLPAPAEPRE